MTDLDPNGNMVTVDGWLRTEHRAHVTRMLRQIATELAIADILFPRPINERVAERAAVLRGGRRRYRGEHRRGQFTVDELAFEVARDHPARLRAHAASLRRWPAWRGPQEPIFIGGREVYVRFYGGAPSPETRLEALTGTLVMMNEEGRVAVPTLSTDGTVRVASTEGDGWKVLGRMHHDGIRITEPDDETRIAWPADVIATTSTGEPACTCEPADDATQYAGTRMPDCPVPAHAAEQERWSGLAGGPW